MHDTFEERFWARVEKHVCWIWTGPVGKHGYGILKMNGRPVLAHRVAWSLSHKQPEDCVLHHCDNRRCVNPEHLFEGSHQDNSDDKIQKGRARHPAGEATVRRKLSAEDIRRIRTMTGVRQVDIAKMFGIKQPHVSRILRGVTWTQH